MPNCVSLGRPLGGRPGGSPRTSMGWDMTHRGRHRSYQGRPRTPRGRPNCPADVHGTVDALWTQHPVLKVEQNNGWWALFYFCFSDPVYVHSRQWCEENNRFEIKNETQDEAQSIPKSIGTLRYILVQIWKSWLWSEVTYGANKLTSSKWGKCWLLKFNVTFNVKVHHPQKQ